MTWCTPGASLLSEQCSQGSQIWPDSRCYPKCKGQNDAAQCKCFLMRRIICGLAAHVFVHVFTKTANYSVSVG